MLNEEEEMKHYETICKWNRRSLLNTGRYQEGTPELEREIIRLTDNEFAAMLFMKEYSSREGKYRFYDIEWITQTFISIFPHLNLTEEDIKRAVADNVFHFRLVRKEFNDFGKVKVKYVFDKQFYELVPPEELDSSTKKPKPPSEDSLLGKWAAKIQGEKEAEKK